MRVPGGLAVVVGVDVDKARCDDQAVSVHFPMSGAERRADLHDHPIGNGDIRRTTGPAGAIHDESAADHQVVHAVQSRFVVGDRDGPEWSRSYPVYPRVSLQ